MSPVAAEGPDGHILDHRGIDKLLGVLPARPCGGNCRSEAPRVDLQQDKRTVDSHGMAEDIDPVDVDRGQPRNNFFDPCQVRRVSKPGHLRSEHVARVRGANSLVGKMPRSDPQLLAIVGPATCSPMQ